MAGSLRQAAGRYVQTLHGISANACYRVQQHLTVGLRQLQVLGEGHAVGQLFMNQPVA